MRPRPVDTFNTIYGSISCLDRFRAANRCGPGTIRCGNRWRSVPNTETGCPIRLNYIITRFNVHDNMCAVRAPFKTISAQRKKVNIFIPMLQPLCKWTDLQRCDVFPFHDPKRPLRVPDSHPPIPSQLTNPLYRRKRLINSFSFSYFPSNGSTNPGRPQLSIADQR